MALAHLMGRHQDARIAACTLAGFLALAGPTLAHAEGAEQRLLLIAALPPLILAALIGWRAKAGSRAS